MIRWVRSPALVLIAVLLVACGHSSGVTDNALGEAVRPTRANIDRSCDNAAFPSPTWSRCEVENFAKVGEGAQEQQANAAFLQRETAQILSYEQSWLDRAASDPSWLDPRSGNTPATPVTAAGTPLAIGDPYRWPGVKGANGDAFYEGQAIVTPVLFYDQDCARLPGRIWRPRNLAAGRRLPGIVIEVGSFQAPEAAYWWAAQALVRSGYEVMTYDVRGQARADWQSPDGEFGTNLNSTVFLTDFVNAVDFFHSTPAQPYPHNPACAGIYPTPGTAFNPHHDVLDRERLGIAGHSAGAIGVSVLQSYDAPGAPPWPGLLDWHNPVNAVVAWDALGYPGCHVDIPANVLTPSCVYDVVLGLQAPDLLPVVPHLPALNLRSEYGFAATAPFPAPPDPEDGKHAYRAWVDAGVPIYSLTVRGSTHTDFSPTMGFPSPSWCPGLKDNACTDGWALPLYEYYTLVWFDRWLKRPGEPGYADADQRLVDDARWAERLSWHLRSARSFPDRGRHAQVCEDIRAGC